MVERIRDRFGADARLFENHWMQNARAADGFLRAGSQLLFLSRQNFHCFRPSLSNHITIIDPH